MPARPLLSQTLPPQALQELREAEQDYIDEMIRRVGLSEGNR